MLQLQLWGHHPPAGQHQHPPVCLPARQRRQRLRHLVSSEALHCCSLLAAAAAPCGRHRASILLPCPLLLLLLLPSLACCSPAQTYSPGGTEEHLRPECIECKAAVTPGHTLSPSWCVGGWLQVSGVLQQGQAVVDFCAVLVHAAGPVHFVGSLTPGADSLDDCTSAGCLPGYHLRTEDHAWGYYAHADRTPTLQCVGCPHDTFSPGGNTTSCTPCGFRQAAPPKSPSREYCQW